MDKKNASYSIHTFELEIPLEKDFYKEYKSMLDIYCTYQPSRSHCRNMMYNFHHKKELHTTGLHAYCYNNEDLFHLGISNICLIERRLLEPDGHYCTVSTCITFKVNPRILLGYSENKYICIVPDNELEKILPALIYAWEPYGLGAKNLQGASIKRLDICTNIILESQLIAEQYLKLLRKGGYYKGLTTKVMPVDKTSHRRMHPPNEVRYRNAPGHGNRVRENLSIYLKHAQMKENASIYTEDEINLAKGQIRFELRISRNKIPYLKNKYGCEYPSDLIGIAKIIGTDILAEYLAGLYCTGKFVKTSKAVELIQASRHRKFVKRNMVRIVKDTRQKDMAYAFRILTNEEKCRYKKYFNELGISPITFADSWKKDMFENPTTYIMTNNVNER